MNKEDYKKLLREKEERLVELLDQQEHLETEIAELKQEIGALAILAGEAKDSRYDFLARISGDLGLIDAIREVMRSMNGYLTPKDIRDGLDNIGYNIGEHSNILASIHTTLRRMAQNGEVEESNGKKKAYRLLSRQEQMIKRMARNEPIFPKKD